MIALSIEMTEFKVFISLSEEVALINFQRVTVFIRGINVLSMTAGFDGYPLCFRDSRLQVLFTHHVFVLP